jgi:SAM-dependent methyltransferase
MTWSPVDAQGDPPPPSVGGNASLYDELAEYYDLIHAHVKDDIPFYLSLAQETGGPILELGCGSGRTLIPLAEAGFKTVGLDNSRSMLERARERVKASGLENSVRLVEGEMVELNLGQRFPLITVPFNTWMHLPGRQAQTAALRQIARHLAPGGKLVIDIPAPSTIVDVEHDGSMVLERISPGREKKERVLQFSSTRLDEERQILHVTWIYDVVNANRAVKRLVVPMALCYLFPQQAKESLQKAGLAFKTLWGDYDRSPYSAASNNLIIVATLAVE